MTKKALGVALGSNLGNRIANLRAAVEGITSFCKDPTLLTSSVYETEPVDCPEGSEPFFNAVIQVRCNLEPLEVLRKCQAIETKLGRPAKRPKKHAPRIIDIDLLYYGGLEISEKNLELPHPHIMERRFVLEPLCEIRPGLMLPRQKLSIEEILSEWDGEEANSTIVFPENSWL